MSGYDWRLALCGALLYQLRRVRGDNLDAVRFYVDHIVSLEVERLAKQGGEA